jgi:hypothetical protein
MPVDRTEKGIEQAIQNQLLMHGYCSKGDVAHNQASLGLDAQALVVFLKASQ